MTDCREYQGPTVKGYGYTYLDGGRVLVHRWVWEQVDGPIPTGMEVMHTCDNPPCFLYDHLRLGAHVDNMADMNKKRRNGMTKVTHCPEGHEYTPENTYVHIYKGATKRNCRACKRESSRRYRDGDS